MKLTSLPEKWEIVLTAENIDVVKEWLIKHTECGKSWDWSIGNRYFITNDGYHCEGRMYSYTSKKPEYTIITYNQFKKWVLNISDEKEDYACILEILTKLDIK